VTAPFEFEEPEEIPASHLRRVTCAGGCGDKTLAAPGQERRALCGKCRPGPGFLTTEVRGVATMWRLVTLPPVPAAPHPAPERSSRDEEPEGAPYPPAVLKMAQRATEAGFRVRLQSAVGCGVHGATGAPLPVKATYAVVMSGPRGAAYAVHDGSAWKSVMIVDSAGWLLLPMTRLTEWINARPSVPAGWRVEVRAESAAKALAAKKVSCPGAPKCVQELRHEHRADGQVKFPKERKKEPTPGA